MHKTIAFGIAATAVALATAPAHATTFAAGALSPTPYTIPLQAVAASGALDDLLTFTLLANPLSTTVTPIDIPLFNIGFSSFSATLHPGSSGGGSGTALPIGGFSTTLSPGDYSIRFVGTAGSGGAAYTASVAAPVPEPHEWAMMLAGLGLVAWFARRRATSAAAPVGAAA